ncbi:MAG: sigma-70 family RNA polymerase sigma factor [Prevotellaceae bacterium]|jgi:RNA polymerase sigma-70 factor (ECF subfamily)|nr:sigma-70 family RNA polymerase sigma factor [Prevotellaceae bacterium]
MIEWNSYMTAQCMKGDRKAQMQLYKTFYKRIYNSCFRILRDRYEAEDAMQESFLKIFSKLGRYDDSAPFEAWIVRIAINTAIDRLRENRPEFTGFSEADLPDRIDEGGDEDEMELIAERAMQVKAAVEQLTGNSRLIITLYLMEGYDHEEIADILKIQPGNVRVQYMRAKQKLIEIINNNAK